MATLAGFPAKLFGSGDDPVARVPIADRTFVNTKGAALRIGFCGYWETGVKPELSRAMTIEITQGDPAKPGSWSAGAAHDQFAILQSSLAARGVPQPVNGLGAEAVGSTTNGSAELIVRSGDVIVNVAADAPPDSPPFSLDNVKTVAQAVLAKL
jgi:hypothetical protein